MCGPGSAEVADFRTGSGTRWHGIKSPRRARVVLSSCEDVDHPVVKVSGEEEVPPNVAAERQAPGDRPYAVASEISRGAGFCQRRIVGSYVKYPVQADYPRDSEVTRDNAVVVDVALTEASMWRVKLPFAVP